METKQIAAALVKAQRGFSPALKTNTNPHFRSKYADLSACVEAVIDALNESGIMLMQLTKPYEGGVCVSTRFVHESGEMMDAGELTVPASKQDPQGYGSALTYARRYSLMAACGIAPEDDDGNAASKPKAQATAQKEPESAPQPNTAAAVAKDAFDALSKQDKDAVDAEAEKVVKAWNEGNKERVIELDAAVRLGGGDWHLAYWHCLKDHSPIRSYINSQRKPK